MMNNAPKFPPPEVVVQMADSKVAATETSGTFSGPLVGPTRPFGLKADALHVTLRFLSMVGSVAALSFMITAQQSGTVSVYGFMLPVHSKWSFSNSFEYVVGVAAAVAAHSLLQFTISMSRLLRKRPVISSRPQAWLFLASDQLFAYAMVSGGAAAAGVTNLNRTGVHHTALPNFCKPLHTFCDHVAVSIAFTFFTSFLLAASVVHDIVWLSRSNR